ncbi:MAG: HAD-IIB family hydrolase [Candidatus Aenigmarchaeota archaeon]|nr:HAD-IIB family hydrolase [Candidatus Aenigmarchaeota archaeon]MCK5332873.1 HAD-IIB family hydrolase [Candidatus Aenigmarchaeota archaeon]
MQKTQNIIFSDLDGTLIDHSTYSYKAALDAVSLLKKKKIPLIFCTSKTRAEIEKYRKELGIKDPFISENGGAIFVPKKYFDFGFDFDRETKEYKIIELGTPIKRLLKAIAKTKEKGYDVTTFSAMSVKQLSKDCCLKHDDAKKAKMREYDEAFKINNEKDEPKINELIKKHGFHFTKGGRYCHITGNNDKGKAVKILTSLFKRKYHKIKTIGLGDGQNDIPMLKEVDVAVIVKNSANPKLKVNFEVIRTKEEGPRGWNNTVKKLV